MMQQIEEAVSFIRSKTTFIAHTGIILGTGLSALAKLTKIDASIPYGQIPHFVEATVEGHDGRLIFGHIGEHPVVMMQGRFHFYEGYTMQQITFPVRVMKMLGIERLIVSNACGALNPKFEAASLMLIDDHINFLPSNPLVGANIDKLGPRFPDMSRPYDKNMNDSLKAIAQKLNISLNEGVYAAWIGPCLETRAEYRFLKMAGADVVGMSTVPEVIVANHMNLPVAAISVITDICNPDDLQPFVLSDILKHASVAEKKLSKLIEEYLRTLN
ncbi:MAG: purine-nucleoside phosphorylase [Bacteroidetes bacterium]|nr:purine-nucleoside phosphorylase [Bacteroidota bacterium]MBU1580218.1 purine-nucleoside phosphorylase [Bacteroidota bacterium]MBU2466976.1 purine-nucleoside phosphorylase [Bacteroidota bacterium]MBU2557707.1 purine-nucleoside phosphorylase [Bacteroidota bacterium]